MYRNREENRLVEYLYQKADGGKIPLGGVFEISPLCNMNCKMCYVKKSADQVQRSGGLLTLEQWMSLAEEAKSSGTLFLLLTGGEPFFREDFEELYTRLHRMGFVLSINSNGTLIDEKVIKWLKTMPPSRINLTLYGASDETYGRLCGNEKGFRQVVRGIELLKREGIAIKLNSSITPYNRQDIEKMLLFAREQKLPLEMAAYMFPPVRKEASATGKNHRMTPEETVQVMEEITGMQMGKDYLEQEKNRVCAEIAKRQTKIKEKFEKTGRNLSCRAGSSSYWITWDGRMLPCGMMVYPAEYPLQIGFGSAWKNTVHHTEEIRLPTECRNCSKEELCHTCGAMIYAETGAFDKKPIYRCKMAEAYINHGG